MNIPTSDNHCIAFSERDWPCKSLRGMYHHRGCKECGNEFLGPKLAMLCFICEKDKKDVDIENTCV